MTSQYIARVGDSGTGTCYLHDSPTQYTTTFTEEGSSDLLTESGLRICIVGTIGNTTCGHQTIATTGSTIFKERGRPIHRIGDTGHIIGSPESTYTVSTASNIAQSE